MRLFSTLQSARTFDVIILGASGFTGNLIVEQLGQTASKLSATKPIKWAIAGRSDTKLKACLSRAAMIRDFDLSDVTVLGSVNVNHRQSLEQMCRQSKLVVNCVGPYRHFGEQVVDACVKCGTHCVDVSGEPEYLETICLKYDAIARRNGVAIVGSCGFDSVPADLGVQYLKNNFDGTLNSVESYLRIKAGPDGAIGNYATWESLVNGYAFRKNLSQLRSQLFSSFKAYQWRHRIKRRTVFSNQYGYCVPFPGSDRSVVSRSQLFKYTNSDERPTQFEAYFTVNSLTALLSLFMVNITVQLLSSSVAGRRLLLNYPHIFSAGIFKKYAKPTRSMLSNTSFELMLIGKGWNESYVNENFQPTMHTNKTTIARVSNGDPAYLSTSVIVTEIALSLIEECNNQSLPFGVLTPSVAFEKTDLIDRLHKKGIKFEIIQ